MRVLTPTLLRMGPASENCGLLELRSLSLGICTGVVKHNIVVPISDFAILVVEHIGEGELFRASLVYGIEACFQLFSS